MSMVPVAEIEGAFRRSVPDNLDTLRETQILPVSCAQAPITNMVSGASSRGMPNPEKRQKPSLVGSVFANPHTEGILGLRQAKPDELELEDKDLVSHSRSGSREAFGYLYERHLQKVLSYSKRFVRSSDISRDLAQEAFLQTYLSLKHLKNPEAFSRWLIGITRHICCGYLRDKSSRTISLVDISGGRQFPLFRSEEDLQSLESLVERRELRSLLVKGVEKLSPSHKIPIELLYLQRLKITEIADRLGISYGAALKQQRLPRGIYLCGFHGARSLHRLSSSREVHPSGPERTSHDLRSSLSETSASNTTRNMPPSTACSDLRESSRSGNASLHVATTYWVSPGAPSPRPMYQSGVRVRLLSSGTPGRPRPVHSRARASTCVPLAVKNGPCCSPST